MTRNDKAIPFHSTDNDNFLSEDAVDAGWKWFVQIANQGVGEIVFNALTVERIS